MRQAVGVLAALAWRSLWRHTWRTVLTASGVALGLGFLLLMLGLGDGSHLQMIAAAVETGGGHVLAQAFDYQRRRSVDLVLPASTVARVMAWGRPREVRGVVARGFASGLLSSADGATGVSLVGVDPAAEASVSRFPRQVSAGRFLEGGEGATAVVGSGVARVLKARVGSRVVAMAQTAGSAEVGSILLRVVGFVHTGLEALDESLVLVPLPVLQGFLGLGAGAHQVALVLKDQTRTQELAGALRDAFPELEVLTWHEADPQLDAAIRIDNGGHYLINGIFFVIIACTVLNTLLMSVLERRREFALLGALGMPPWRRLLLVLLEGGMMGVLAAGAGVLLGWAGHTYLRIHGLPLAWFTSESLETSGVVLEPVLYSALSWTRIAGATTMVFALTMLLACAAGRHAAARIDPDLLKTR